MSDKKITVELTDEQALLLACLCSDAHQGELGLDIDGQGVADFKALEDIFDNARLGRKTVRG